MRSSARRGALGLIGRSSVGSLGGPAPRGAGPGRWRAPSCSGSGTPWTGQPGPSPDCGYVYVERSLPERTGGTGKWPVVATAHWQVEWTGVSGGVPVEGQQALELSSTTALTVGELQTLVVGEGR